MKLAGALPLVVNGMQAVPAMAGTVTCATSGGTGTPYLGAAESDGAARRTRLDRTARSLLENPDGRSLARGSTTGSLFHGLRRRVISMETRPRDM